MKVIIRDAAYRDLERIHAWIANDRPGAADAVIERILQSIGLLEDHPLAGRARDEVRPGLRSIAARPHVVFYRVTDDAAEIIRVLDGRRDIEEIFAAEPRR